MRRVERIAQRAEHIRPLEQERCERQLDRDAWSGKLDFLRDEARNERANGTPKAWPPESRGHRRPEFGPQMKTDNRR